MKRSMGNSTEAERIRKRFIDNWAEKRHERRISMMKLAVTGFFTILSLYLGLVDYNRGRIDGMLVAGAFVIISTYYSIKEILR